ncbi:MAG TPA: AAA family ATPase, partial [Pirellulales bacterium]|nr:AAA family ATPase [Pirellulales bacterium]
MWQGIEGHDAVVEQFRRAIARGRLASTYLFVGPAGIGKRTFALKLAQTLLCRANSADDMSPCGRCEACVQVAAGTYPDVLTVGKPEDRNEIPIEAMVGRRERRMQEGLCHDLWQKPLPGSRRIAIIDDADALNEESANSLLK